jgi:hypothetical protein
MFASVVLAAGRNIPKDLSNVRGFAYITSTTPRGHTGMWQNYDPAQVERELDLAQRANLNQVRVLLSYGAYTKDKEVFLKNLLHFVRASHQRGIGVMVGAMAASDIPFYDEKGYKDEKARPLARAYAADLVKTLSNEPGLAFWEAANEPDYPPGLGFFEAENRSIYPTTPWKNAERGLELIRGRMEIAKYVAGVFHELDPKTPVTISAAFLPGMEETADAVDVLAWHDYSSTRAEIRANIEKAKAFAAKVGKPVFNTEIGCVGRVNPYDVAIQEHMNAGMGWYIWELMVVPQGWGKVQGVFYTDGTVRDPTIVAAMLGFFRNRGPNILPSVPDNEGGVTRVVTNGKKWLSQPDASWAEGLDWAERAANLLEAGELIAMREPPTRQVDLMRKGQPDLPALRVLLEKYIEILEPDELKK